MRAIVTPCPLRVDAATPQGEPVNVSDGESVVFLRIDESEATSPNVWEYVLEDLPVSWNGQEILYELGLPDPAEYDASGPESVTLTAGQTTTAEIALKHVEDPIPTGNLSVSIFWDDWGAGSSPRPGSVTVHIDATTEGGEAAEVFNGSSSTGVTLDASGDPDNWEQVLEDLPVTGNGKTVTYSFTLPEIPSYSVSPQGPVTLVEGEVAYASYFASLS